MIKQSQQLQNFTMSTYTCSDRQISEEGNLWKGKKEKATGSSWEGAQELQSDPLQLQIQQHPGKALLMTLYISAIFGCCLKVSLEHTHVI